MTLAFIVLGRPQPAGSKRAFKHAQTGAIVVTDDAKGSRAWKQEIASAGTLAMVEAHEGDRYVPLLTGPLDVRFEFFLARPKSHYGTGRNQHVVKASAPEYPAVKPDVDKLSRAVMDALTGIVWRDDAQVVTKTVTKRYSTPERVAIAIRESQRWEIATREKAA